MRCKLRVVWIIWVLLLCTGAGGPNECEPTSKEEAASLATLVGEIWTPPAPTAAVPFLQQVERKQCLLYTMGMILKQLDNDAPTPEKLFQFALEERYTTARLGGLMRIMDIATIARRHGYDVEHTIGNTSLSYVKQHVDGGQPVLVAYYSDRFGNPALPLVDAREVHAGGSDPSKTATGETRADPYAKAPGPAGDGPVPITPVPKFPNRAGATVHAAVLTGIYTDEEGVTWVTAIEPTTGERTWRADQFEASWAHPLVGRQAIFVSQPRPGDDAPDS